MTPPRLPDPADASASSALGAFLRGVDRRGLVFAWLLAGSREAGEQARAWAFGRFGNEAGRVAFGDWPRHFWALLLAAPVLRQPPAQPRWEPAFEWLSKVGHGPRAALLLRLVAGLAESDAATVLGVARPTYRLGLQRALPRHPDGSADVGAWEALGEAAQALVRGLPLEPPATPDPAAGHAVDAPRAAQEAARRPAGRAVRVALWLVALMTALALGATFLAGSLPEELAQAPDRILSEALPGPEAPAGRYGEDDALALHPDLALLLDATSAGAAAADPAFHAWLAAEDAAAAATGAKPADAAVPGEGGLSPLLPAGDPVAAAAHARAEAAAARPAAERLAALDPAARERLALRRDGWDALPHADRGELRERWLAWRGLSADERSALRSAALRFADRAPDAQAALRARFDALDASVRHGWLLGPDLGADYARLHPLIAQVPMDARGPLLEALRGLDAQARDDLAVLAARTPPQARAELRIELLATPPGERGRWLRTRVAPPR